MALDQALTHTGWCVYHDGCYYGGVITTSPKHPLLQRLLCIRSAVQQLLRDYPVQQVFYEQIYYNRQTPGWIALLQVLTMLQLTFHDANIPSVALSANPHHALSWRSLLQLGSATKTQVLQWTRTQGFPVTNEHEADAVCIMLAGSKLVVTHTASVC